VQSDDRVETSAVDSSSWEEDERLDSVVNYTLQSHLAVSESRPQEAVAGTGHEGVIDAAADISNFPRKNDL